MAPSEGPGRTALPRQLEETHETPRSSRDEGLIFLHVLETNHESSLQTEEQAGVTREPGRAPPRHAHGDLTSLAPHERLPERAWRLD